jgi:hypothetical protein
METLAKKFLLFVFISTIPMQLVTAMWVLTVGCFNWVEALHTDPYILCTIMFVLFAFAVVLMISEEDIPF